MFAKTTQVGFAQRVVATLVASAVLLWSFGVYINTAQASNLVSVSDLLTTSNPGVTSGHTISFIIPTSSPALQVADDIVITFPVEFTGIGSVDDATNADVSVNGTDVPGASIQGNLQEVTMNTVAAVGGDRITVAIDDGVITNPAATTSYEIVIQTDDGDIGRTRVAIVDTVLVTAIVDTAFEFIIEPLATGTEIFAGVATTTGQSSTTTLDFGKLVAGVPESLGQRLNVTTNSREGFVVTVETDGDFQSANGAVIDVFDEASDVSDVGTLWNSPVTDISDETTWGHWGMTTNDGDLNSLGGYYSGEFNGDYIAASTTPRVVFHHDGPSDGSTPDKGQAEVLYTVEITPLQEAADDYNTTLTYIATPTF